MKFYELTYLISPQLSEEELKNFSQKINNLIQEQGGILEKIRNPIRRRLAFPIKKREEAFLTSLNFYFNPERIKAFEEKIKAENEILRYIILSKKVLKTPPKPKRIPIPKPKRPKTKVELKEIEKKLEEILKE